MYVPQANAALCSGTISGERPSLLNWGRTFCSLRSFDSKLGFERDPPGNTVAGCFKFDDRAKQRPTFRREKMASKPILNSLNLFVNDMVSSGCLGNRRVCCPGTNRR